MKSFLIVLSSLAPTVLSVSLDRRAGCNADNCARAVTGTAFGAAALSSHISQCSSYFSATVIPPATTIWNPVATTYVFSTLGAVLPPSTPLPGPYGTSTTITPTDIPAFASAACDGNTTPVPVRYSSACSCAGVTKATTIAASPTCTEDFTTTITVSSFLILASGGPLPAPEYLQVSPDAYGADSSETLDFTADITQSSAFLISGSQLEILGTGLLSNDDAPTFTEPLFFDSASAISTFGYTPVDVSIGQDLSVTLTNTGNGDNVEQDCGGLLNVGPTAGGVDIFGNQCSVVGLTAVPL